MRIRRILRWIHIITGLALMAYVYAPFSENPWFAWFIKLIAVPFLAVTGVMIWQFPRIFKKKAL